MYGPGHEHGHSCLHVAVSKIRRKKDLHGLTIENHYGGQFSMVPESCMAVWAALKAAGSPEKMGAERGSTHQSAPWPSPSEPPHRAEQRSVELAKGRNRLIRYKAYEHTPHAHH